MATWRVSFDIDLPPLDDAALQELLDNGAGFQLTLNKHAKAALHEYVEAYLGRRAFTKGSDILELRLAMLIEHAFDGRIPNEAKIGTLLQSPPASSRTLLRNALSKYRRQLEAATKASAKQVLEDVTWSGDVCHSKTASPNLVELLNQQLLIDDVTLKPISRVTSSGGTYVINEESYASLCAAFGATAVPK